MHQSRRFCPSAQTLRSLTNESRCLNSKLRQLWCLWLNAERSNCHVAAEKKGDSRPQKEARSLTLLSGQWRERHSWDTVFRCGRFKSIERMRKNLKQIIRWPRQPDLLPIYIRVGDYNPLSQFPRPNRLQTLTSVEPRTGETLSAIQDVYFVPINDLYKRHWWQNEVTESSGEKKLWPMMPCDEIVPIILAMNHEKKLYWRKYMQLKNGSVKGFKPATTGPHYKKTRESTSQHGNGSF